MLFKPKLMAGCSLIAGCGASVPFFIGKECVAPSDNTVWKRLVKTIFPVLDCHRRDEHYQVNLAFKNEYGPAENDLSLQVVDVNKKGEVKWGPRRGGHLVGSWQITKLGRGQVAIIAPNQVLKGDSGGTIDCQQTSSALDFSWKNDQMSSKKLEEIKFELSKQASHKRLGREEYDIVFSRESGFRWKEKHQPKAIFCSSYKK